MAESTSLARPYARAAFEQAQSEQQAGNGRLADWADMLATAANIAAHPDMRPVLHHPGVTDDELVDLFGDLADKIGGERFDAQFTNFLRLLQENDRLSLLPEVAALFAHLRAEAERTLQVTVTSAVALTPEQLDRLVQSLARRFDRQIELDAQVDDSMLGGAIIRAGDTVIDGSMNSRLDRLRDALAA